MTAVRFRVYRDPRTTDEFVIFAQGHVVIPGRKGWDASDVIVESMLWSIALGLENTGWLAAEMIDGEIQLAHVPCRMGSRALKDGTCEVCLVAGPKFRMGST